MVRLQYWSFCCILQLCLYEQRGTRIYKNISLILFSKRAHSLLLVWEIDGKAYTQRGDFFLSHIFFRKLGGANTCTPPCKPYCQRRPRCLWSAAYLWVDSRFSGLCLNLTAWFSFPVISLRLHTCSIGLPRRTPTPLFTNHYVTACQSTRGHQERTENPCHMLYITLKNVENSLIAIILKSNLT